MDKVLDGQLSFETNFRDFAVRNYDVEFTNPHTGKDEFPVNFGNTWQDIYAKMPKGHPTLAAAPALPVNQTTESQVGTEAAVSGIPHPEPSGAVNGYGCRSEQPGQQPRCRPADPGDRQQQRLFGPAVPAR